MSDPTPNPPATTAPAAPAHPRGYFNQAQLEDLDLAITVLDAARFHEDELVEREITPVWITSFANLLDIARGRSNETSYHGELSKHVTAGASQSAAKLISALRQIQSAAKQKHQMLAEDGNPATNFSTDGYLIGQRIDANRAMLLQSAADLINRAATDGLPGFKTPDKIQPIKDLLAAYRASESDQQEATRTKELIRLDRDELLGRINIRRAAIQHAADSLWPASDPNNRPLRKAFRLPLNRTMGL